MKKTIKIEGMSCVHCARAVTRALSALEGVSDVEVSLENKQASIEVAGQVSDQALRKAVAEEGYRVAEE